MRILDLLVSIRGRIGRAAYWLTLVPLVLTGILGWMLSGAQDLQTALFGNILGLAILWPLVAVNVKRWHDRDKPGYWMFIGVVPVLGQIWTLVECGLLSGTKGYNAYGEPPPQFLLPVETRTESGPVERAKAVRDAAEQAEKRLPAELVALMKMTGLMMRTDPHSQREKLDFVRTHLADGLALDPDAVRDAIAVAAGARFSKDAFEANAEIVKHSHEVRGEPAPSTWDASDTPGSADAGHEQFTFQADSKTETEPPPASQVDATALNAVSDLLFHIAMADDKLSEKEEILLSQLYGVFGFRGSAFSSHRYMYGGWQSGTSPQVPIGERPHYYAKVLGITGEVTPESVRKAYRRLVKEYHPDKVVNLGPKLREAADVEMKKINEAYAFFSKRMGM